MRDRSTVREAEKKTARASVERATAAILAGGRGTRLQSVVADRPKVLAEVHGRPYLTYLLDELERAGLREVVLLTGYQANQVRDTLGAAYGTLRLVHSPEPTALGTGGALRHALTKLSSPVALLLNGDSWCDVDLTELWSFHRRKAADLSMALIATRNAGRYGRVLVGPNEEVEHFEEKAGDTPGWMNAGVYLIDRGLIEAIPADMPLSLERDLIPHWLEQYKRVFGYRHVGRFLDIGTPESYAAAATFFRATGGGGA
jgi:D-glycero-alpha-D-manno-heptose 1-phosphate guanylyltransferase